MTAEVPAVQRSHAPAKAVPHDPTTNVRLLETVDAVVKGGVLVPRASATAVR